MPRTGTVHTEGANIVYDYEGDGPLLLTIAGGGGDAMRYAQISNILADEYTVVNYDRRCNSRSTGDASVDLDMAQSASDAAAVIRAMGVEKAYVFGNSGGANIGLKLAEDLPEVISGLIVHEPPVMSILPDAETWLGFVQRVHETYISQGTRAAMALFFNSLVGFDAPSQVPGGGIGGTEYGLLHGQGIYADQHICARSRHHLSKPRSHHNNCWSSQCGCLLCTHSAYSRGTPRLQVYRFSR